MTKIGFIGAGNMGGPMIGNLCRAGHDVQVYDLSEQALNHAVQLGAKRAVSVAAAVTGVDVVITMLPVGSDVRQVYLEAGILEAAAKEALLIDSSTIDVESSQAVHAAAAEAGYAMLDAPVSGGTGGAEAGSLTFMCGGAAGNFNRAKPILEAMGHNMFYCGGPGMGQVVKICNNMIAGASILLASESLAMGEKLGVDRKVLYDVITKSSGNSWVLERSCPAGGVLPAAPSSNDYKPGFAAKLMLKDLRLAVKAAEAAGAVTPLGTTAANIYQMLINKGMGEKDAASVFQLIAGEV